MVLERLPADRVFQEPAETFRVLSDPGRVRSVYYSLDDAHIRLLLDVGLQHVSHEGTT